MSAEAEFLCCLSACSWAKSLQLATTHLFMIDKEKREREWQLEMPFLVRTWKREMAVSRRYNNVTSCMAMLLYVVDAFHFLLAFFSFHFLNACACCLHIHFCGSVYLYVVSLCMWKCARVRALKYNTNKKNESLLLENSFRYSIFFSHSWFLFSCCFFFFSRIHIKYDCSSFICC